MLINTPEFDLKNNAHKNNIALLIDADNANSAAIEHIINEINIYGKVTVRRIYADWTTSHNGKWKEKLNNYAIRPIQKFSYTTGKNSTDTALIIDAMDLLYSETINTFCIVSSDSDYTGLVHRIREQGMHIIGVGKEHTPIAFKKACSIFIREENLIQKENKNIQNNAKKSIDYNLISRAFEMVQNENETALLSKLGEALRKVEPEFDSRSYGFKTFRKFCENLNGYEIYPEKDGQTFSIKLK